MDPDELLDQLRDQSAVICRAIEGRGEFPRPMPDDEIVDIAYSLADGFLALDRWLTNAGFPPQAWRR